MYYCLAAKLCPALDVPVNGEVKGDSFRYNRTVEYKCNHGYELVYGDRSRRCTASGQWTGVAPRCKRKKFCACMQSIDRQSALVDRY